MPDLDSIVKKLERTERLSSEEVDYLWDYLNNQKQEQNNGN